MNLTISDIVCHVLQPRFLPRKQVYPNKRAEVLHCIIQCVEKRLNKSRTVTLLKLKLWSHESHLKYNFNLSLPSLPYELRHSYFYLCLNLNTEAEKNFCNTDKRYYYKSSIVNQCHEHKILCTLSMHPTTVTFELELEWGRENKKFSQTVTKQGILSQDLA